MIKRINHIKDFGVFKDYQRSGDVQDFAKLNIIYGWNASLAIGAIVLLGYLIGKLLDE